MKDRERFLEKMRSRLLDKKGELVDFLANMSKEGNEGDRQVMDSADEASSLSMDKLQSSIQETEIGEMKQITEALVRLDKGQYGVCVGCGKPISDTRLEHSPYAARCISCQETLEG